MLRFKTQRSLDRVYLIRDEIRPDCILGTLIAKGQTFHVLERPWKNNAPNISCIPAMLPPGVYRVDFLERSASGKYKNCYWIRDVKGRYGVLIHNGNVVAHTKGCLIIGRGRGWLARQRAVLNSKTALSEFVQLMGKQPFELQIIGDQVCHGLAA